MAPIPSPNSARHEFPPTQIDVRQIAPERPPSRRDTDSGCDCDILTITHDNDQFKDHFETCMNEYDPSCGHRNVAVLLLSWKNGDLAGLEDEV